MSQQEQNQVAKAAGATHQDHLNPNTYYRLNRTNSWIEKAEWDPRTEMLSEWKYTGLGHIPDWAGMMK